MLEVYLLLGAELWLQPVSHPKVRSKSFIIAGNIIDPGSTILPVNKAGFKLNAALHKDGRDVVYHTHSHAGTAVRTIILLTKITAVQNEDTLSYYRVHGLNFLPVVFAANIRRYGLHELLNRF